MTAHSSWFEAVGLIAACLTTSSFLPQGLRIWRTRSARDVSLAMYLMMTAGTLMWLSYGLLIGSLALIVSNVAGALMVGSVLALKIHDMLRPRNLLVEIVEHEAAPVPVAPASPVNSNDAQPKKPSAAA